MRKHPPTKTKNKKKSLRRRVRAMSGSPAGAERVTRDSSAPSPDARAGRASKWSLGRRWSAPELHRHDYR